LQRNAILNSRHDFLSYRFNEFVISIAIVISISMPPRSQRG
jgi:hypothetical protein